MVSVTLLLVAMKVAACRFLVVLANVFNICWFIVGNIYMNVFGNWSNYNLPNSDDNRLKCDDITFMFSFILLIMAWVTIPISCILCCVCATTMMGCLGLGATAAASSAV